MKKLLIVLIGLTLSSNMYGQLFNKTYSTDPGNYFNMYSGKNLKLSDGSYLINTPMMMGSAIVKINQSGDTVWCKQADFSLYSPVSTEALDGSIFLFSADGGAPRCTKISSTGNLLWSNMFGVNSFNMNSTIAAGNDGVNGIVLQGTQTDSIFAYGIDGNGNFLWQKGLVFNSLFGASSSKNVHVDNLIMLNSGNYLVAARAVTDPGMTNKLMLITLNTSGSVLSVKTFDYGLAGFDDYWCNTLYENSNGDIFLSGIATYNGVKNSSIMKLDAGLNFLWGNRIADDAFKAHFTELSNGELALSIENSYLVSDGNPKNAIIKTSSTGNVIWGRTFGSTSSNMSGIIGESNGYIHVIGATNGFGTSCMMTYNTDFQGNAVGCHDVISSFPEASWNLSLTTATFTEGVMTGSVYNAAGAISAISFPMANIGINVTGTITNPLCYGENGDVAIGINGGVAPYEYSWSNGTNSQNLVNAAAGNYVFRLSDNQGCVELDTFDITEPSQLVATYLRSNVTCFGSQNGSIDLTVSGGTPGYTYSWATQDTTQDISGLSGGFYQVIITDTNACEKIIGISISEPQQLFAAITTSQNVSCYSACDGSLSGIASGGVSPYNLQWNDAANTNGSIVSGLCPGNYLFTVTDNNGCISYSNGTITEPLPIMAQTGSTDSECAAGNGSVFVSATGGTMPYSYLWSNGSSSDTATSLNPGTYTVDVVDNNGCVASESATVNTVTNPVEICVVTVDSLNNNLIVWEKPLIANIQGFFIYRNIAGAYSQIGYQPYDSLSQYTDNSFGVDPEITSYRYEISVLDSCGNESMLSNYHETIHLTTNLGINGEVNLIWDDYEGFVFSQYNILRDSTGNGNWEIIASVPSTNFTFTDLTPPQSNSLDYMVEVILPATCSATKAQDHNSTRSNRATAVDPDANTGTSIEELILSQANVYPNPTNGNFFVEIQSNEWMYELYDLSGKLVSTEKVMVNRKNINIASLERGIYLMKIILSNSSVYKRVIKE